MEVDGVGFWGHPIDHSGSHTQSEAETVRRKVLAIMGVIMRIPAKNKLQMLQLIEEGSSLHPSDLESLHRWAQTAYETLQFSNVQQQRFDEYCRSSWVFTSSSTRLSCGVSMLKQALHKYAPEN